MTKQGDILEVIYPINIPSDIKDIFPNVLSQYSPPIHQSSFSEIAEIIKKNGQKRRILRQNLTPEKNLTEPGFSGS